MNVKKKVRVVIIKSNTMLLDARLTKEVQTLSDAGYEVHVLEWSREGGFSGKEVMERVAFHRFSFKAPYARFSIVFLYPFFWCWVVLRVAQIKPDIVHACNLDSGIVSYVCWKLRLVNKFVFDIYDGFALSYVPLEHRTTFRIVHLVEDKIFLDADVGIIPSVARSRLYTRSSAKVVAVVMNTPPDIGRNQLPNLFKSEFVIVHAGIIGEENGDLELAQVAGQVGAQLVLAGRVDSGFVKKLRSFPHLSYLGILSYPEALALQSKANVVVVLYLRSVLTTRDEYAEPQRIYEAMMLGKPIITNVKKDVIEGFQCGFHIDPHDLRALRYSLEQLIRDPNLAYKMGMNGRNAYEKHFTWSRQAQILLTAYEGMLAQSDDHPREGQHLRPNTTLLTKHNASIWDHE
ncbi:MAG: glycosyltransferase [Nitrososphaerales archaeon]